MAILLHVQSYFCKSHQYLGILNRSLNWSSFPGVQWTAIFTYGALSRTPGTEVQTVSLQVNLIMLFKFALGERIMISVYMLLCSFKVFSTNIHYTIKTIMYCMSFPLKVFYIVISTNQNSD